MDFYFLRKINMKKYSFKDEGAALKRINQPQNFLIKLFKLLHINNNLRFKRKVD